MTDAATGEVKGRRIVEDPAVHQKCRESRCVLRRDPRSVTARTLNAPFALELAPGGGSVMLWAGGRAMTEAEWPVCEDPKEMLKHLGESAKQRKLRLFDCLCYRAGEPWKDRGESDSIHDLIPLAEQLADGIASEQALENAWQKFREDWPPSRMRNVPSTICLLLGDEVFYGASTGSELAALLIAMRVEGDSADTLDAMNRERATQAPLLREIFMNPFRPVTFSPEWCTDTALSLARQMYESRDFSAMPILADALQDAGCENSDILDHCRGSGPHVRGCWVVDLVLGKE